MSQGGARRPYFQVAVLKRDQFLRSAAGIDPIRRGEQDQPIWKRRERDHDNIYDRPDNELQLPRGLFHFLSAHKSQIPKEAATLKEPLEFGA